MRACQASLPLSVLRVVLVAPCGWVDGVQAGCGGGWRWSNRLCHVSARARLRAGEDVSSAPFSDLRGTHRRLSLRPMCHATAPGKADPACGREGAQADHVPFRLGARNVKTAKSSRITAPCHPLIGPIFGSRKSAVTPDKMSAPARTANKRIPYSEMKTR